MSALPNSNLPMAEFVIEPDPQLVIARMAEMVALAAESAIAERSRFSFVLSGGSTPKALYELLATEPWNRRIEWPKVHLFWEDERWVPAASPKNNYRMTREALISRVPIPSGNVHRVQTDSGTPEQGAVRYAEEIASFFGGSAPVFDFLLLGLGTNGHTASLFPHRPTLHETARTVVSDYIEEVGMYRVTLTVPVLNSARQTVFLATGAEKAAVVDEVVNGPYDPERLPSQLIRPVNNRLTWFLDSQAASQLPGTEPRSGDRR